MAKLVKVRLVSEAMSQLRDLLQHNLLRHKFRNGGRRVSESTDLYERNTA